MNYNKKIKRSLRMMNWMFATTRNAAYIFGGMALGMALSDFMISIREYNSIMVIANILIVVAFILAATNSISYHMIKKINEKVKQIKILESKIG